MSKEYVIIVAGGTGSRMNSSIPKQFLKIGSKPVIAHTIGRFYAYDPNINVIIAVHKDHENDLRKIIKKFFPEKNITVTLGGETRFHSVANALALVEDNKAVVGIHDAARPFVAISVIKACFAMGSKKGNAIPAIDLNESIREIKGKKNNAVNRSNYKIIQTPQCFSVKELKKAFTKGYSPKFTDDATVLESIGKKINLVQGNFENIKITNPNDLLIANIYVKNDK